MKAFSVKVLAVRESGDGMSAAFILDIEEIYGCTAWAVNKTNGNAIIKHFGDDEKKIVGKKIALEIVTVRNPSAGTYGPGIAVAARQ